MDKKTENILLVDDESLIIEYCERLLKGMDLHILTASDGEKALDIIKKEEIDFVLTDLIMPGKIDGVKLSEEIRRLRPSTDVVIMTAYPTLETAIPVLKNGAYDYLIKPFDPDVLKSVVRRCLEKRRLSQELNNEKMMRQELAAAYSELQKVESLKESFLSLINHELRTPLVPSLLALESLESELKTAKTKKLYATLSKNIHKMKDLIETLLVFTEIHKSGFETDQTPVNIINLLEETKLKYRALWEEMNLKIDVTVMNEPIIVHGSADLIQKVFEHLMLNAIHFSKKGGDVTIRCYTEEHHAHISFSDHGIGIPKDKIPKIYDSFYQAADYLTRETGGLGLGLAIVRRIVEAHGGAIFVESEEGKGTSFNVNFQMKKRTKKISAGEQS